MSFLERHCTFCALSQHVVDACIPFDCGHADLNDFFANDAQKYAHQLLGKSYCFRLDKNPEQIVCAFTISNESIKMSYLPNSRKKKVNKGIPRAKQFRSYPGVLIGRLGVSVQFKQKGIGREILNFIKSWFIHPGNKTGCRFLVVDAYNEEIPLNYYQRNDFQFLFSSQQQEKSYLDLPENQNLKTRLLYFDLIMLSVDE